MQADAQKSRELPHARASRLSPGSGLAFCGMLLAQSGKSRGFRGRAPEMDLPAIPPYVVMFSARAFMPARTHAVCTSRPRSYWTYVSVTSVRGVILVNSILPPVQEKSAWPSVGRMSDFVVLSGRANSSVAVIGSFVKFSTATQSSPIRYRATLFGASKRMPNGARSFSRIGLRSSRVRLRRLSACR